MTEDGTQNLIENLVSRLEAYAANLEKIVSDRTKQYQEQKDRADDLLYQILPRPVRVANILLVSKHSWAFGIPIPSRNDSLSIPNPENLNPASPNLLFQS